MSPLPFLLAWLTLPLFAYLLATHCKKLSLRFLIVIGAMIAGYVLFVCTALIADVSAHAEMMSFDLDGDGGLGGSELTPEAQIAIENWGNDTGRTMAPFLGAPVTVIWYSMLFAVLFVGEWALHKLFPAVAKSTGSEH